MTIIFLDLDCPRSSTLALALLVDILLLTVSALSLLSPSLSFSPSSVSLFLLFYNKVIHGECFFSMSLLVLFCFLNKLTSWYSTGISKNFRIYFGQYRSGTPLSLTSNTTRPIRRDWLSNVLYTLNMTQ